MIPRVPTHKWSDSDKDAVDYLLDRRNFSGECLRFAFAHQLQYVLDSIQHPLSFLLGIESQSL